jgi:hypothetical protein
MVNTPDASDLVPEFAGRRCVMTMLAILKHPGGSARTREFRRRLSIA